MKSPRPPSPRLLITTATAISVMAAAFSQTSALASTLASLTGVVLLVLVLESRK